MKRDDVLWRNLPNFIFYVAVNAVTSEALSVTISSFSKKVLTVTSDNRRNKNDVSISYPVTRHPKYI